MNGAACFNVDYLKTTRTGTGRDAEAAQGECALDRTTALLRAVHEPVYVLASNRASLNFRFYCLLSHRTVCSKTI